MDASTIFVLFQDLGVWKGRVGAAWLEGEKGDG